MEVFLFFPLSLLPLPAFALAVAWEQQLAQGQCKAGPSAIFGIVSQSVCQLECTRCVTGSKCNCNIERTRERNDLLATQQEVMIIVVSLLCFLQFIACTLIYFSFSIVAELLLTLFCRIHKHTYTYVCIYIDRLMHV